MSDKNQSREPVVRCALCGRPEPLPAGTAPRSGVHICSGCSGRARFEAQEGGRGLTGKDPRPM